MVVDWKSRTPAWWFCLFPEPGGWWMKWKSSHGFHPPGSMPVPEKRRIRRCHRQADGRTSWASGYPRVSGTISMGLSRCQSGGACKERPLQREAPWTAAALLRFPGDEICSGLPAITPDEIMPNKADYRLFTSTASSSNGPSFSFFFLYPHPFDSTSLCPCPPAPIGPLLTSP